MSGQRFYADPRTKFTWANGAVGYSPSPTMDILGPYAKVTNCPIDGTDLRRTCYATDYGDTHFSVPAATTYKGKRIVGYFGNDHGDVTFHVMDSDKSFMQDEFDKCTARLRIEQGLDDDRR